MNNFFVTKNGEFIKCCWIGGIDKREMEQLVADMQKKDPDSEWTPYCYYKKLTDTKNDYSVYVGSKGLREELESILTRLQEEEKFEFTEK